MRKAIVGVAAAAFLGGIATMLTSTPAAAVCPPCVWAVMESKKDKNFKAVNPYAPTKVATKSKGKKKAKKKM
jgi:hypothetical protein